MNRTATEKVYTGKISWFDVYFFVNIVNSNVFIFEIVECKYV